jgi:hypothetical protein
LLDTVEGSGIGGAVEGLAIDEFNYCRDGAGRPHEMIDGAIEGLDTGLDIDALLEISRQLPGLRSEAGDASSLAPPADTGGPDFNALPARGSRLEVAGDLQRFTVHGDAGAADRFLCIPAPGPAFVERPYGDLIQGTAHALRSILAARRHRTVWTHAPGEDVCEALREYAAHFDIRVQLTDGDLAGASTGSAWLRFLEDGYPRVLAIIDGEHSHALLEARLGRPARFEHRLREGPR